MNEVCYAPIASFLQAGFKPRTPCRAAGLMHEQTVEHPISGPIYQGRTPKARS